MYLPDKAKDAIAKHCYTKTIAILEKSAQVDSQGAYMESVGAVKSTFKGSIRFINRGEEQTEAGLILAADVQINCASETAVAVGDLLQYENVVYVAKEVFPYDSHKTIMGEKWESK